MSLSVWIAAMLSRAFSFSPPCPIRCASVIRKSRGGGLAASGAMSLIWISLIWISLASMSRWADWLPAEGPRSLSRSCSLPGATPTPPAPAPTPRDSPSSSPTPARTAGRPSAPASRTPPAPGDSPAPDRAPSAGNAPASASGSARRAPSFPSCPSWATSAAFSAVDSTGSSVNRASWLKCTRIDTRPALLPRNVCIALSHPLRSHPSVQLASVQSRLVLLLGLLAVRSLGASLQSGVYQFCTMPAKVAHKPAYSPTLNISLMPGFRLKTEPPPCPSASGAPPHSARAAWIAHRLDATDTAPLCLMPASSPIAPLSGCAQQSWEPDRARRPVNGHPAPRFRVTRVTSRLFRPVPSTPTLRATRQKRSCIVENDNINLDGYNAISRRIVEVTDEDETIFAEFIDLSPLNAGRAQ